MFDIDNIINNTLWDYCLQWKHWHILVSWHSTLRYIKSISLERQLDIPLATIWYCLLPLKEQKTRCSLTAANLVLSKKMCLTVCVSVFCQYDISHRADGIITHWPQLHTLPCAPTDWPASHSEIQTGIISWHRAVLLSYIQQLHHPGTQLVSSTMHLLRLSVGPSTRGIVNRVEIRFANW